MQKGSVIMNKKVTSEEYQKKVERKVPRSNLCIDCVKAFLIGGAICAIGQGVLNFYLWLKLSKELAAMAVSVTMIFIGVLLTGLDLYRKIAKHGGAGTLVPITGFANAVASPAIEAKTEGYVLGVGVKLFSIAGPVIVYGIAASVAAGVIIYLFGL